MWNVFRPTQDRRRSLTLVTVAGCLAMVYMPCIANAIRTDFFRECGFTKRHFGILNAIPLIMFALQFLGALWANRLRSRKLAFMVLLIAGRVFWLGVVLVPLFGRTWSSGTQAAAMLTLIGISSALLNLGPPIWFTWMADLVPPSILNRYWGNRSRWMWWVWVGIGIWLAIFSSVYEQLGLNLRQTYTICVTVGVTAGVIDILLFIWVPEPPNTQTRGRNVMEVILEPLRERQCRSFLIWKSAYMASTIFAAAYMILYLLEIGVPQWQVVLLAAVMGSGQAVSSNFWGRLADRHGHRPIVILCSFFKPFAPFVFLWITPTTAMLILVPFFFVDSMLNAGMAVAANGFMLKFAPQENRSMFVAAMSSFPSIAAGIGALLGGELLTALEGASWQFAGRSWRNFHVLFAGSFILRFACILLARRIKEPTSTRSRTVLLSVTGELPVRLVSFPIGIYRRVYRAASAKVGDRNETREEEATDDD